MTSPQQPQEHCGHECVCGIYYEHYESQFLEPCRHEINCPHDTRSRPAPLTQNDGGDCLVICQHCGKVTQVQCKKDGD